MTKSDGKNLGGRPSKIDGFLVGFEKVINEGSNAIFLTDEDLFILANEDLEENNQISYTTFKVYKASKEEGKAEGYKRFQSLYKKALVKQKQELFKKLEGNEGQWQKYAWIIERKFEEWNLKKIVDSNVEMKGEGLNVSFYLPNNGREKNN